MENSELRSRLIETESAASKAKKELQVSLKTAEDLKRFFDEERTTFEVQKKDLEKRVQDAEGALNPVTEELTGLKCQIDLMTSAIFGKHNLNSCLLSLQPVTCTGLTFIVVCRTPCLPSWG